MSMGRRKSASREEQWLGGAGTFIALAAALAPISCITRRDLTARKVTPPLA
ncbi:hypothetical protein [Bradyrhizobium sp. 5.13L]